MRRRFEAEARLAAQLDHPRIGAIFDVGHEDGVDYFVMEFIEGRTLAERIAGKPLPFAEMIGYAIEIAAGLAYAHGRGVEHHDLKPGNVLLTSSGVKVIDFGLAKLRQSERRPSGTHGCYEDLATADNRGCICARARPPICRRSGSRDDRRTIAVIFSRSVCSCTRWRPGGARSTGPRPRILRRRS